MANYEITAQQNQPGCGVQDTGLNIQQLIDKGVLSIAGARDGNWFRFEFSQE